jgi:hypothetical protein
MRAIKVLASILLILALIIGAAYASLPAWIGAVAAGVLDGTGIHLVALDADRPTLRGWRVTRAQFAGDGLDVRLDEAAVEYRAGELMSGRLEAVSIARLTVALGPSTAPNDASPSMEIPDLWALIPANRVRVARLEIDNAEPEVRLDGDFEFDPSSARGAFHVESALLPTPIDATVAVEPAGGLQLTVAGAGAASPIAALDGRPDDDRIAIEGRLDLEGEPFALVADIVGIEGAEGHVRGTVAGSLPWPFDAARWLEIVLDGRIDLDVSNALPDFENGRVDGEARIALRDGRLEVIAPAVGVGFSAATLDGVRYTVAPDTVVPIALEVAADLEADDLPASIAGHADARLAIDFESADPNAIVPWGSLNGDVRVVPRANEIDVELEQGLTFDFGLPDVDEVGLELLAPTRMAVDPDTLSLRSPGLELALRVPELRLGTDRLAFRDARLVLTSLTLDGDRLRTAIRLAARSSDRALPVTGELDADLAAGTGKFNIAVDGEVNEPLFGSELPGWRSTWDLDAGRLKATFAGTYRDTPEVVEVTAKGRVELDAGLAQFDEILLSGLSVGLPVTIAPSGFSAGPGRVRVAALDPGVALTDVDFVLRANDETAELTGLDAHLLGGVVTVEQLAWDIEGESADFVVHLRGVELADVFALEGEDITGHGVLDGTLPVSTDPAGIRISGGQLAARPPGGHIEYRGALTGQGIPGLDLAMTALRNFDYKVLTADADYDLNGTLTLAVKLQGSSPQVENGRAIHFNVNVTEDIPALLQSLRASDSVTEGVQRRFSR